MGRTSKGPEVLNSKDLKVKRKHILGAGQTGIDWPILMFDRYGNYLANWI